MQEIKIKPKVKIKLLLDGGTFTIRKPNLDEMTNLEEAKAGSSMKLMKTLLVGLGITKKCVGQMDADQLTELIGHLLPEKKRG